MKPKLLLHICCAPDATVAFQRLSDDYQVTGFFYNPNIHPESEYTLRLEEAGKLSKSFGVELIKPSYDAEEWFSSIKGYEKEKEGGLRCMGCFFMRMEKTAIFAKENGFEAFTTNLTVSPHKNADLINSIGEKISKTYNIKFLPQNLKKNDGFKISVELSRKHNLYRQNYCGCKFSKKSTQVSP